MNIVNKALNFEKVDRIPLWNVSHFGGFVENWRKYLGISDDSKIVPAEYYGYDTEVVNGDESFFFSQKKKIEQNPEFSVHNDGWGRIIRTKNEGYFSQRIDGILKDKKDLNDLTFDDVKDDRRFKNIRNYSDDERCVFAKIGGIYIRSSHLWSEEELLVDMALDEGFVNELFDRVSDYFLHMAKEIIARTGVADNGLFIYDDIAGTKSPVFSPLMFEKYFLPRYKKLIREIKSSGVKKVFLHSDGNIGPLLDLIIECGFDGINPVEPRCGLDIVKLKKKYGRKLSYLGGVCNTVILPGGNKKEIEAHVRPLIEAALDGGAVIGMASAASDISPEAYDYYMNLLKNMKI